jgi:hypothetical protein
VFHVKTFDRIQIDHQPDATIFQFIILTFIYSSKCFGRSPADHQEINGSSSSVWFYLHIVVITVLCSWSRRICKLWCHWTRRFARVYLHLVSWHEYSCVCRWVVEDRYSSRTQSPPSPLNHNIISGFRSFF